MVTTPFKKRLEASKSPANFLTDRTSQRETRYRFATEQRNERLVLFAGVERCVLPKSHHEGDIVRALASKIASDLGEILATAPEEPVVENAMSRAAVAGWTLCSPSQGNATNQCCIQHTGFLRFIAYRLEQLSRSTNTSRRAQLLSRFVLPYKPDHKPELADKDIRVDCPICALNGSA